MDSISVFKNVPASIKRLIYVYLIGLGTSSSKLIKEAYDELYEANKNHIFINKYMITTNPRDIGFMGIHEIMKICVNHFFVRTIPIKIQKQYKGDIGSKLNEGLLLPQQLYEIDGAKMFYLYNCSNANKFNIMFSQLADNRCLEKLFKYKILQLKSEEE